MEEKTIEKVGWTFEISDVTPIFTCIICGNRSFGDSVEDGFHNAWNHSIDKHRDLI